MDTWIEKIAEFDNLAGARQHYGLVDVSDERLKEAGDLLRAGNPPLGRAKRFYRDKADGGARPLVNLEPLDKIIMRATLKIVQPSLNADLPQTCYSRVGAGTRAAISALYLDLLEERPEVVYIGDFADYYGQIDRDVLQALFERKFQGDSALLELLLRILYLDVVDDAGNAAGRGSGIEQGLPVSPLLSNLYLARLFDPWLESSDVVSWGRYGDDFYALPRCGTEKFSRALRGRLDEIGLSIKEEKVAVSTAFSAASVRRLTFGARDEAGAIEWLKSRFVPHRMLSGSHNVIVEKCGGDDLVEQRGGDEQSFDAVDPIA